MNSHIIILLFLYGLIFISISGCTANYTARTNKATEAYSQKGDLYVVDCLLPGQVRQLGNIPYISPRRATKTTTYDCRIRGGEYVDYDRADYRSALKVWLPLAKNGDAQAQNYIAEIYEKGVGGTPDYALAANWYQQAAAQGNARAQLNLGYFHEKGLGVKQDTLLALNYYRQAAGIDTDQLVLNSHALAELETTTKHLNQKISQANSQIRLLADQITHLTQTLERKPKPRKQSHEQDLTALQALYDKTAAEKQTLAQKLASVTAIYRSPNSHDSLFQLSAPVPDNRTLKNVNFGRYYALIIGNQDYLHLDDLMSPLRDAKRLQQVLEQRYGFKTFILPNAPEKMILHSLDSFYQQISEKDNLLIYYAGHGEMSRSGFSQKQRGYWLPVDAHPTSISNWINNAVISDHLDRLKARSVMVVADSCYAGELGSEKSSLLFGLNQANWHDTVLKSGLGRKARIVISSGGNKPVLDGGSEFHSIFTSSLIDVLEKNTSPIRDSELFSLIAIDVQSRSERIGKMQTPEMKPIREAGHEGGSFYFIPTQTAHISKKHQY